MNGWWKFLKSEREGRRLYSSLGVLPPAPHVTMEMCYSNKFLSEILRLERSSRK